MKLINTFFIPVTNGKIEKYVSWRVFRVFYFIILTISIPLIYNLNNKYYSNCSSEAFNPNIPWSEGI